MSSNVKTNHTIFFLNNILPPTYSKYERKICMQKCENDAEKLIRKVTLKMIKNENNFFFNYEDAFLESLHSIFSHLQHKKLATVSFYNKKLVKT